MKFGKRLKQQIEETLPEWRDKFLSYKDLKKLLRYVSTSLDGDVEAEFVRLLVGQVEKFNYFFVEKEEDFVIRHKELQERIEEVRETMGHLEVEYKVEMRGIRRDLVNLHGEMVLLENYSSVNYTGLAKILKKYDKRTGRLLRLPFIEKVLKQPFFTTDLVSSLIKDLEDTIATAVFPIETTDGEALTDTIVVDRDKEKEAKKKNMTRGITISATDGSAEMEILRNTVAALTTVRELRSGSSTYSHFSLPPIDEADGEQLRPLQPSTPISILY